MRVKLCQGVGTLGKSHCVMAATALLNGEEFRDTPDCVSAAIAGTLISINDSFYDDNDDDDGNNTARDMELGGLPWTIIGTREPNSIVGIITLRDRLCGLLTFMFPDPRIDWREMLRRSDSIYAADCLNEALNYVDQHYAAARKSLNDSLVRRSADFAWHASRLENSKQQVRKRLVNAIVLFPAVWHRIVNEEHSSPDCVDAIRDFMVNITDSYRDMVRFSVPNPQEVQEGKVFIDRVQQRRMALITYITDTIVPMYTTATTEPSFEERLKPGCVPNLFLVE